MAGARAGTGAGVGTGTGVRASAAAVAGTGAGAGDGAEEEEGEGPKRPKEASKTIPKPPRTPPRTPQGLFWVLFGHPFRSIFATKFWIVFETPSELARGPIWDPFGGGHWPYFLFFV